MNWKIIIKKTSKRMNPCNFNFHKKKKNQNMKKIKVKI